MTREKHTAYRRGTFSAVLGIAVLLPDGSARTGPDLEILEERLRWELRTYAYDEPHDLDQQKRFTRKGTPEKTTSTASRLEETLDDGTRMYLHRKPATPTAEA